MITQEEFDTLIPGDIINANAGSFTVCKHSNKYASKGEFDVVATLNNSNSYSWQGWNSPTDSDNKLFKIGDADDIDLEYIINSVTKINH